MVHNARRAPPLFVESASVRTRKLVFALLAQQRTQTRVLRLRMLAGWHFSSVLHMHGAQRTSLALSTNGARTRKLVFALLAQQTHVLRTI